MGDERKGYVVTIEFPDNDKAKAFALWLCEAGEQDYFEWGEYRDDPSEFAFGFDYHSRNGGKFGVHVVAKYPEESP